MASWQPGHDRPLLPWSPETVPQQGRHVHILDEPEQLRGPLSPHRKDGIQDGESWGISFVRAGTRVGKRAEVPLRA